MRINIDMLACLLIVFAIAGILVYMGDERRKNKMYVRCREYAGIDWVKERGLSGVAWTHRLEGLQKESTLLGHRAKTIALELRDEPASTKLRSVSATLESFFKNTISGTRESRIRSEALSLASNARALLYCLSVHDEKEREALRLLRIWAKDVEQWVKIVDTVGYKIACEAKRENKKRRSNRY